MLLIIQRHFMTRSFKLISKEANATIFQYIQVLQLINNRMF